MRTFVYVDGFNLYYRAVRGTPHRWLDINALCGRMLHQRHNVLCIKYFTANVQPTPYDPQQHTRQQTYLRALGTIPHLQVIRGHFMAHVVDLLAAPTAVPGRAQAHDYPQPKSYQRVIRAEEKGSDVNLAVYMVADAFRGLYDAAVVVSNDSDLAEAFRIVKGELRKTVGLLCPSGCPTVALKRYSTFIRTITASDLAASQLAPVLRDAKGDIHKPPTW